MRPLVLAAILATPVIPVAPAWAGTDLRPGSASPAAQCRAAISQAERTAEVPDRLMQAIGVIESGRRDETGAMAAYPWTINAAGVGSYYASKAEAIAAVLALRAQGVRSIDVGCMQVNLLHHADAFASLDEAFDPASNAHYAARFLKKLLAQDRVLARGDCGLPFADARHRCGVCTQGAGRVGQACLAWGAGTNDRPGGGGNQLCGAEWRQPAGSSPCRAQALWQPGGAWSPTAQRRRGWRPGKVLDGASSSAASPAHAQRDRTGSGWC